MTSYNIIHDALNMRSVCARWMSRMCSEVLRRNRVECWMRFVRLFEREGEAFLRRIVTVDETWISLDTNQKKEQSTIWTER